MKEPIRHEHFNIADTQAREAFSVHRPGRIIGICGLPGAGKTFLRNCILRDILGDPASWGVGNLPAVESMALLDIGAKFSSRGFAARSHRSLLRPDLRAVYRDADDAIQAEYAASIRAAQKAWAQEKSNSRTSESDYWSSFVEAGIDRKLKWFLVEHATAFGDVRTDESSPNHIQNIMSVTEAIGAMAVLNFTPEGYRLWAGRPEIKDRMDLVYLMPYDLTDQGQQEKYAILVLGLASQYNWESESVIEDNVVEIGIATATSVRPLEELFARANRNALAGGKTSISAHDLAVAMPTTDQADALWRQVRTINKISKPATSGELMDLHKRFLDEEK